MEFKYILFPTPPFVGLGILCVKVKTFLRGERVLRHKKGNCFPSYPDHYLN